MTLDATLDVTVDTDAVFTFRVAATDDPVTVRFSSGKVADVVVEETDGATVWQWGTNRMFTQALQSRTIEPGTPLEQTFTWEDPPAGEYVAVGRLEADQDVEARTTFQVSDA
jgi:hypothetical protein